MNSFAIAFTNPIASIDETSFSLKSTSNWDSRSGPNHARQCLDAFRERYNRVRPHWALRPDERVDPLTPADVYEDGLAVIIPKWQGWARAALSKLEEADREPEAA